MAEEGEGEYDAFVTDTDALTLLGEELSHLMPAPAAERAGS